MTTTDHDRGLCPVCLKPSRLYHNSNILHDDGSDAGACWMAQNPTKAEKARLDADAFWSSRLELEHVRTYAQAQMAAPWGVLAVVLARIICQIPPAIVLPDIIHDEASLNLTIALVGRSGDGKGGATSVARRAVDIGAPSFVTHTLGSGQGIAHGFGHFVNGKDGEPGHVERDATSVLFVVEEVDHIAANRQQNGSTVLAEMRRFAMGEKLGHLYVDRTRRVEIAAHHYRGAIVVGVQPARAGVILDDADGGTPQRFTWWPTIDIDPPDVEPERPDAWSWTLPRELPDVNSATGLRPIEVCQAVRDAVRAARRARVRGEGDPLEGHALLTRERVAAALGAFHGHYGITDDDWQLAGQVMAMSDAVRTEVAAALAHQAHEANAAKGEADAARAVIVAERVEESTVRRVTSSLYSHLGADWTSRGELRRKLSSRDRDYFEPAIDRLIVLRRVHVQEDEYHGSERTRYRDAHAA